MDWTNPAPEQLKTKANLVPSEKESGAELRAGMRVCIHSPNTECGHPRSVPPYRKMVSLLHFPDESCNRIHKFLPADWPTPFRRCEVAASGADTALLYVPSNPYVAPVGSKR